MNLSSALCHALFTHSRDAPGFERFVGGLAMKWTILLAAVCAFNVAAETGAAREFGAELRGHALLPATTTVAPPRGAPAALATSGKYTGKPGSVSRRWACCPATRFSPTRPRRAPRPHAADARPAGAGLFGHQAGRRRCVLGDRRQRLRQQGQSADAMLAMHRVRPDWQSGSVKLERTVFLSDPQRRLPFLIVNEGTTARYLTGADSTPSRCRSSATQSGSATSSAIPVAPT